MFFILDVGVANYDVVSFRVFGSHDDDEETEPIELTSVLDNGEPYRLPPHQKCASHALNLVAGADSQKAENDHSYCAISKAVFTKCQNLWAKQNQSLLAANELHDLCGR